MEEKSSPRSSGFLETFYEDVSREYKRGLSAKEIFKVLELQENWAVRLVSGGKLSKLNMVKSVIADIKIKTAR